jgi:CRP/FNR family transcriptional regulator, cyclic AMP receptor protein
MEESSHKSKSSALEEGLQYADTLSKFKLFAGFHQGELESLIGLSDVITVPAGTEIVREGDPGHCMFVILSGKAKVFQKVATDEFPLAELAAGDFFGEVSLVDDGPRSASVLATEECRLLKITRMVIGVLAGIQPSAAIQLLAAIGRSLVQRLRAGNQKYLDLLLAGHIPESLS